MLGSMSTPAGPLSEERLMHGSENHCFGCSPSNQNGLRLVFTVDGPGRVHALFALDRRFEGPPGFVHGGIIATLMDEAMSKANRARGLTAMTRHIEVDYLKLVPLDTPLHLYGMGAAAEGRKHWCEARIETEDGVLLASGRGLFLETTVEKLMAAL
jgi:uncharacterized protein (TIGR00369 family)